MASIAGTKFGTPCDHLVRRPVTMFLNLVHTAPFSLTDDEYYCRVDADIDVDDPHFKLYVNGSEFQVEARIGLPDGHLVIFTYLFGGFGSGGFGGGGFGGGVSLDSYPPDEFELEYRTYPRHCSKCILKDGEDRVVRTSNLYAIAQSQLGYGIGPYGPNPYG